MRNLFCCAAWALIAIGAIVPGVAQSGGKGGSGNGGMRDKLIGAWRLAWLEEQTEDGKTQKSERQGILLYTRDGHMSVQIIAPKQEAPPASGPVLYEQGGYEAYYGTYAVNEQAHTVTHHVEGALVRTLIGNNLTRVYRFSGKQLVLTSSRPDEHWTIAWEHY